MYMDFRSSDQIVETLCRLNQPGSLWLVLAADCHGDEITPVLDALRNRNVRVCGGIFPGLIHGNARKDSGIIAIQLPDQSAYCVGILSTNELSWQSPPPSLATKEPVGALILTDCLGCNISGFLEDIYNQYGNDISYSGAGAGYHDLRKSPSIFAENGLVPNAALLILIPRETKVRVQHGWKRVLGPFVASHTDRNIIKELNWESAGRFYRKLVEGLNPALAGAPVFPDLNSTYPLCIAKEGGEDVLRDPISINEADEIVVLSDVTENAVMYLAHGDQDSLIDAAGQAVEELGELDNVDSCLIFDCYSRALMIADEFPRELRRIQEKLAALTDVIPEGVLALGEIAANNGPCIELFNKTIVIAATCR
jgi:hypothetical protein